MKQKQLTENDLAIELEKRGFTGISKRTVGDWRREGLLPDFDITGRGRGKGQGRTEGVWTKPDLVIEQAIWILRMKAVGIPHEEFHLNLWILGYSIHPEDARDTLLEPLEAQIEMLECGVQELQREWRLHKRTEGILEDVIYDGVTKAISEMQKSPVERLVLPEAVLDGVANLILNSNFNLTNLDDALSDLEDWGEVTHKFGSELFEGIGEEVEYDQKHIQSLALLLKNADFIQRHFSLHPVKKAVRECTHEDLAEVQADLGILSRIVMIFTQTIGVILPHIKPLADSSYNADEILPALFKFAAYFVLADISLRRNGYSKFINQIRGKVLDQIEQEFSEKVRKDFEQAAPFIGQAYSQAIELVERRFTEFAADSSKLQFTMNN